MIPGLVSVIVVNWNGAAYLADCLDSLRDQSYTISACAGFPETWEKRREIFRRRKIDAGEFYRLLRKYRISARELALRD